MGRRAGGRESQKTCRLSRIVNNGKVVDSWYEDTEPLEVEESWVQALSPKEGSRLFYCAPGRATDLEVKVLYTPVKGKR